MGTTDPYNDFAERYDQMKPDNPARRDFFAKLFGDGGVNSVLDCACGTGFDLLMFKEMGFDATGSDVSESMLGVAREKISKSGADIEIRQSDFLEIHNAFDRSFDAVVCLGNSINEVHDDEKISGALVNWGEVLNDRGLIVFDQGQTDASMVNPPKFAPVVNDRDFTRAFSMEYENRIMTVHVLDFIHTEEITDFRHSSHEIKIRLVDDWSEIVDRSGYNHVEFFGDWNFMPYDKTSSKRLICVIRT